MSYVKHIANDATTLLLGGFRGQHNLLSIPRAHLYVRHTELITEEEDVTNSTNVLPTSEILDLLVWAELVSDTDTTER
jgi:hypothetical protein